MGTRFYDVYCGLLKSFTLEEVDRFYQSSLKRGFYGCAPCIEVVENEDIGMLREKLETVRRAFDDLNEKGERVYLRCTLKIGSQGRVKRLLPLIRRKCDLVAIEAASREIAAFASRDRRIDIITLVPNVSPILFRGDISYLYEYGKFIEVVFASIIDENPLQFARKLAYTRSLLQRPLAKNLPVLISSGPTGSVDSRALLSFAETVLGIKYLHLRQAMSTQIEKKLSENQEKRQGIIPVEGVRLETGGQDEGS
ncbi:MAG: RNase P subunit p30 family protein [Infirmifilum sp.]